MKYFIAIILLAASQVVYAADVEIITSKNWSAFKTTSASLGSDACVASTQLVDQTTGLVAELSVVKKLNTDGTYSSPFVTVGNAGAVAPIYGGNLKTDKTKAFSLTLWQNVDPGVSLLSRYNDNANVIKALRNDNTVVVNMVGPNQKIALPFSLSGSSKVIAEMDKVCL